MSFRDHVPILMAMYGLRAIDVCERSGVGKAHLSRILSGEKEPRPETRERIVNVITEAMYAELVATDPPRRTARTSQTATR